MRRLQRLGLHGKNAAIERDKEKKRRQKRRYVQDVSNMTKQSAAGGTSQEFVSAFDYLEFKDRPSYMTIDPKLVDHWDQSSPEGQRFVKRVRRREQILDARAMRRLKKNLKVGGVAGLVGAGALISARNKKRELSSLGELMEFGSASFKRLQREAWKRGARPGVKDYHGNPSLDIVGEPRSMKRSSLRPTDLPPGRLRTKFDEKDYQSMVRSGQVGDVDHIDRVNATNRHLQKRHIKTKGRPWVYRSSKVSER